MPRSVIVEKLDSTPFRGFGKSTVRVIQKRLAEIRRKQGAVTKEAIVSDARDPKSPLHRFFEWDDSAAAEKYRLAQAGEMIRRVQVVVSRGGVREPMRLHLSVTKDDKPQFLPTVEVLGDAQLRAQFMMEMKRELESVARRLRVYEFAARSLKHVQAAIDALVSE